MFEAWGRFVYRFRWPVLLGALALVIASVLTIGRLQVPLSTAYGDDPRMEAQRALALADRELPSQVAGFTLLFTAIDPNLRATDPAFAAAMERALAPLRADPRITQVVTDPAFVSRDGHRAFAVVGMRGEITEAQEEYPALRALVRSAELGIMATGGVPINVEWVHVSERDLQRSEIISLPLAALALLQGDAARARDFYGQAIQVDSGNVLARLQLASLYEHTFRDYHAAARMCGEARLLAPATPGVADCVARNQRLNVDELLQRHEFRVFCEVVGEDIGRIAGHKPGGNRRPVVTPAQLLDFDIDIRVGGFKGGRTFLVGR